eukprot:2285349-Rhodomonas_salina.1
MVHGPALKQQLVCFVMEEPGTGKIVYKIAESAVSWGARVLDSFLWLTENVGQTQLLEPDEDVVEGYCRCRLQRGIKCGRDCEMRK